MRTFREFIEANAKLDPTGHELYGKQPTVSQISSPPPVRKGPPPLPPPVPKIPIFNVEKIAYKGEPNGYLYSLISQFQQAADQQPNLDGNEVRGTIAYVSHMMKQMNMPQQVIAAWEQKAKSKVEQMQSLRNAMSRNIKI